MSNFAVYFLDTDLIQEVIADGWDMPDVKLDEMKITKVRSAGFAPYSKDPFKRGVNCSKKVIQQKIDALKGIEDENKNARSI